MFSGINKETRTYDSHTDYGVFHTKVRVDHRNSRYSIICYSPVDNRVMKIQLYSDDVLNTLQANYLDSHTELRLVNMHYHQINWFINQTLKRFIVNSL